MAEATREELDKKVEEILDKSDLNEADRNMWLGRFENSPDPVLNAFVVMFESDIGELKYATKILTKKIEASGNVAKHKEIVKEEKDHLLKAIRE